MGWENSKHKRKGIILRMAGTKGSLEGIYLGV
jgi:hypothetical protein